MFQLQRELQSGDYQPGGYRLFTIFERKPQLISAAPFRDRVVHHAIMNVIEPTIDRSFINDSYACQRGKGTHAAVDKYQQWAHHYRFVLIPAIFQRHALNSYNRHSGRDSRQAILPVTLWVNANLFQTDLCRNPEHRDVIYSRESAPMEKQPCVYILASDVNGTLYIGVTSNLIRHVYQHRQNLVAEFTQLYDVHNFV